MPVKAAAKKAAQKPFFRFTHSKALRKETLSLLDAIDDSDEPTLYREELGMHLTTLTEHGLKFFFLAPLAKLKMGFVIEQGASLSVASVVRLLAPVMRTACGRMNEKQLRQVSKIMREMMV